MDTATLREEWMGGSNDVLRIPQSNKECCNKIDTLSIPTQRRTHTTTKKRTPNKEA